MNKNNININPSERLDKMAVQGSQRSVNNQDRVWVFISLDQKAFPLAKYWFREEWRVFRKSKLATSGITDPTATEVTKKDTSTDFGYLTDVNGNVISLELFTEVKGLALETFRNMDLDYNPFDKDQVPLPLTWARGAPTYYSNRFRHTLEEAFEFLRFCSNGWKSQQLATHLFRGYRQYNKAPRPAAEGSTSQAPISVDEDTDADEHTTTATHKRKQAGQSSRAGGASSKRPRGAEPPARTAQPNSAAPPANPLYVVLLTSAEYADIYFPRQALARQRQALREREQNNPRNSAPTTASTPSTGPQASVSGSAENSQGACTSICGV